MKKFKVTVRWITEDIYEIEANDLDDALGKLKPYTVEDGRRVVSNRNSKQITTEEIE